MTTPTNLSAICAHYHLGSISDREYSSVAARLTYHKQLVTRTCSIILITGFIVFVEIFIWQVAFRPLVNVLAVYSAQLINNRYERWSENPPLRLAPPEPLCIASVDGGLYPVVILSPLSTCSLPPSRTTKSATYLKHLPMGRHARGYASPRCCCLIPLTVSEKLGRATTELKSIGSNQLRNGPPFNLHPSLLRLSI